MINSKERRRSNSTVAYSEDSFSSSSISSPASRESYRKMIHLKSEHKRRAQISDGFELLKAELPPAIAEKKLSKNELLAEAIRYVEYLEMVAVRNNIMTERGQ